MASRLIIDRVTHQLPQLTSPPLHQSLHRYLTSIEPLVTREKFEVARKVTLDFGRPGGVGERLQKTLESNMLRNDRWVNERLWRLPFLEDRRPYFALSAGAMCPTQSFRGHDEYIQFAAALTAGVLDFYHLVETGTLSQDVTGGQPLCMKQYEGLFSTCRIPGVGKDIIAQTRSRHIVVASNNHFYQVDVLQNNGVTHPVEALYNRLQYVNKVTRLPDIPVGLLTTENRSTWGRLYGRMKANPENQKAFDSIGSALFLLCLDSAPNINTSTHPAHNALLGGGSAYNSGNRWFNKTIQLFVGSDGSVGAVYDHSISDGATRGRMLSHALAHAKTHFSFKTRTELLGDSEKPTKLTFQLDSESNAAITSAGCHIDKHFQDVQFSCLQFEYYGKHFLKACGVSPDGFIQMAIQLTNFRLFGRPMPSRESVSLREFRHGRLAYVRVVTNESCRFVHSMIASSSATTTLQCRYLMDAIRTHKQSTHWAKTGDDFDRHLHALKLTAIEDGEQLPAFFNDHVYLKTQRCKTISSQITLKHVNGTFVLPKFKDAYGVFYNVLDNHLFFTISAYKPSNDIPADNYNAALQKSLLDMKSLLAQHESSQK